jgi:cytochrome c-type biogenesis protein CcmH/NrfF
MRAKLETGVPPSEILKEVFATYGDQYRAVPPFAGVGALVWLVPIGFVVIGLLVALRVSIRRKRIESPSSGTAAMGTLSAEDERRIQEELSKLD